MSSRRTRRSVGATSGLLAAVAVIVVGAAAVGAKPAGRADSGTVYFATTYSAGGKTYAAGNSIDKLFGNGAVTYAIKTMRTTTGTITITSNPVTLYFKNGTLTGKATATLTVTSSTAATITNGKLNAAQGTGGQEGHSVIDTFSGTGNPTAGTYKITYKGTYK
jgi:hypothetical protein